MSRLDAMGLSPPQLEAVLDPRSRVLVAAGAGSGKTRLLVACVVHALVDEGLPAERLVAVTFTRKAGAELASRVRASLEEGNRPDLARSLDSAVIGTIDGLCRRLVKDRALAAGVDPTCAILEPEAAVLLKDEVIRQVWELAVERADEARLEVLASWGKSLRTEVVALYDRLRGLGHDLPQITIRPGPAGEQVRSELARLVGDALAAGDAVAKPSVSLQKDLAKLRACLDWLQRVVEERARETGFSADEAELRASANLFPSRMTPAMEVYFEPVRTALRQYRCRLAETRLRPLADAVNALLADFCREYAERKQGRGLLDFADLELKARALLAGRGLAGTPSPGLPGAFLLVDEFQDTNELQCAILEGLGADRALLVGDERQSIYRFRGADVEVFRRRKATLGSNGAGGATGGLHRLDVSYRSCAGVLDFINRLFAHSSFFGDDFAPLEANPAREAAPRTALSAEGTAAPRVELLVVERGQGEGAETRLPPMQQSEAAALGAKVHALVRQEGWRQSDIVVLLPAQTHVNLYQEALLARGIDVYVVRGRGYYAQEEVTDVVSLLRLLVNPHDDLALISVLRSPLVGMSDNGLYLLGKERRATRPRSLWEVARSAYANALAVEDPAVMARFLERLAELRPRVGRPGLARLIDDAISACSYDVCVLAAPNGRRRFANVRKLMRLAAEFEAASGPDLNGFVAALESMGDLRDREGSAPTLAEGEDVVRVMTVHQAKGLEFPVVALAGLGSNVPRGEPSMFAIADDGRVGLFLKGYRQQTYELYDPCWGPAAEIAAEERRREQEEDVRLLYVAMTRAQERLVLVGARPAKDATDDSRIGRIVTALGLAALPGRGTIVPLTGLDAVAVGVDSPAAGQDIGPGQDRALGRNLEVGPLGREYQKPQGGPLESASRPRLLDLPPQSGAPRRVSFSALAAYQRCPRRFYLEYLLGLDLEWSGTADEDDVAEPAGEGLLDDDERHAGRDVGILVHALLEQLPAGDGSPTAESVRNAAENQLAGLRVRLSPEDLDRAVALSLNFWESPLAEMRTALSAMREAPFLFAQGETLVSGMMDLVCLDGDSWRIVDYKTNAVKGRSPAELAETYSLQASVYCLAALRAGASTVQMDLLFLERPSEPVTACFGAEDVSRLEENLDRALAGLRRGSFPMSAGEACGWCSVAKVCGSMARA